MVGFHGWEVCIGPLNFRWRGWGHFSIRRNKMIKREDVIIDPTDPRVANLIGKKVVFGCNFKQIMEMKTIDILLPLEDNCSHYHFIDFIGEKVGHFSMIAPIPEPVYKPYDEWGDWMLDVELKDKATNETWVIVGRFLFAKKICLRHSIGNFVAAFELKYASEKFTYLSGKPFGIKEN